MKSGLKFLVAAKRCEIGELQQLALTSALVNVTGRLVHGLQRERGLSNLHIGSQGTRFADMRARQIEECREIEAELRACFDSLNTESARVGHGARLFSRIAYVLHGLDALDGLRERVTSLEWTARQATDAYVRLVAGLLAVVFEAADSASDPEISRLRTCEGNEEQRLATLQAGLQCGTHCGSCVPELKRLVRSTSPALQAA